MSFGEGGAWRYCIREWEKRQGEGEAIPEQNSTACAVSHLPIPLPCSFPFFSFPFFLCRLGWPTLLELLFVRYQRQALKCLIWMEQGLDNGVRESGFFWINFPHNWRKRRMQSKLNSFSCPLGPSSTDIQSPNSWMDNNRSDDEIVKKRCEKPTNENYRIMRAGDLQVKGMVEHWKTENSLSLSIFLSLRICVLSLKLFFSCSWK